MLLRIWKALRYSKPVVWFRNKLPDSVVNLGLHLPKAILANFIYGFPSKKLSLIGVTGTKGKTSVAHLIHHILVRANRKVGLISTLGAFFNAQEIDTGLHVTNPDPFALQRLLRQAVNQGLDFVVLEVTSQGLAQFRNFGLHFRLAVFTQVRSDHLEYHGSEEAYLKAKAKLIKMSDKALLNAADPGLNSLLHEARVYGVPTLIYRGDSRFKSQNYEAAIAAAAELGIAKDKARKALSSFPGVVGRMEIIKAKPFTIVIDFAHTPDSLEAALTELRPLVKRGGRLIAVFGCAGERDPGRRKMGAVAAKLTDFFIITAEDPRDEGVEKISEEIAHYARAEGARELSIGKAERLSLARQINFIRLPDRQAAINFALENAVPGDVVGLFGKGHEQSMCFGREEHPWSETEAVKKALRKRGEK